MANTAVGSLVSASGTPYTSLGFSSANAGDVILFPWWVNAAISITAVSGVGATWSSLILDSTATVGGRAGIFMGVVTTPTSGGSIVPTFSSAIGSSYCELAAQEFSSGLGASTVWSRIAGGSQENASSLTVAYPSLTPAAAGELYFGFGLLAQTANGGSTSGYVYAADGAGDQTLYNLACTAAAQAPTSTQTAAGISTALGVLLSASLPGGGPSPAIESGLMPLFM